MPRVGVCVVMKLVAASGKETIRTLTPSCHGVITRVVHEFCACSMYRHTVPGCTVG